MRLLTDIEASTEKEEERSSPLKMTERRVFVKIEVSSRMGREAIGVFPPTVDESGVETEPSLLRTEEITNSGRIFALMNISGISCVLTCVTFSHHSRFYTH